MACDVCGEEIINEREVHREGLTLCRACAGVSYYQPVERDAIPLYAYQREDATL